ncbi:MAG: hypothetical protein COA90_02135 [Gammaproteobacteria bacterium]|nr:MAG: hypothetical protein COA90_02135 [Gammaproteobacteria bacterium]
MKRMGSLESVLQNDGVIFLTYGGLLTQALLVALTESLEKGVEGDAVNKKTAINIFTVFIEVAQNIMNYSSQKQNDNAVPFDTRGLIVVGKGLDDKYYVFSQNVMAIADQDKLETKLTEVIGCDRETVKRLYREARRDGRHSHSRGGGIGMYEIAKKCEQIEFEFDQSDKTIEGNTLFRFKATIA